MANDNKSLIHELYGSTGREVYYVQSKDQTKLELIENKKPNNVLALLQTIFLPQGYPDSVSPDYMAYQIWDTAQAFCSTIAGTIATQEVLRGVGVGDTTATPLAATITWVVKNSCGHLGRIIFAWSHGTYLDAYSKKWRLYADLLNDAAMCTELALPLFKGYVTPVLCITTMMQSVVGVAGGATRAALTQHHARRGNLADVSAKDSAQETAVNLIASLAALALINLPIGTLFIFASLVILHMFCNYMAVRAVCLKTLNEPRYLQVIKGYISDEIILNPCVVNKEEPVFLFYQDLVDDQVCGFRISMGKSFKTHCSNKINMKRLKSVYDLHEKAPYIIVPNIFDRTMYVHLKNGCTNEDILKSYFHSILLSIVVCNLNEYYLSILENKSGSNHFAQVCHTLESADWTIDAEPCLQTSPEGFINEPSIEMLKFMQRIVDKEWPRFREGLVQTGWNIDHHLLMTDEWRITENMVVDLGQGDTAEKKSQ